MSVTTTNYSHKAINAAIKHYEAFFDNSPVSKHNFDLNIKFIANLDILELQAKTFAGSFKSHYHMQFENRMSIPLEKIEQLLFETYIYSFVKCIHNAFFRSYINSDMSKGLAFEGHAKLYNIIRNQYFIAEKESITYTYSIGYGDDRERRALFIKIFSKFKFLKKYLDSVYDSYGTQAFFISEYEGYLSRMKNRVSELRTNRVNSNNANQQNANTNPSSDTPSSSGVTDNQSSTGTGVVIPPARRNPGSNGPQPQNRGSNLNVRYPNGLVEITEVNDVNCSNIINFEQNPLFNALLSEDGSIDFYIPITENKPIIFNASYFFTKANFIVMSNDQENKYLNRAYQKENVGIRQIHFISSHVYTNTGIKPYSVKGKLQMDKIDKYPTAKIFELIRDKLGDKLNLLFVEILEKVSSGQPLEEIDLDELLNKLLERFVK